MALSQVNGPAPFPQGQPFPATQPQPYLGITAAQRGLLAAAPGLLQSPTTVSFSSPSFAPAPSFNIVNTFTQGALASDPRKWTPQEAADQTNRAIARIAQVNPELARNLAEQAGRKTEAPSGGGFFHDLLTAVGSVFKLPGIKQVVDVASRSAHIVPEILADEEHQSVWGNIAQALAGHSTKGWGQVLDKYNVLTGDSMIERVLHNGLALAGDIATDPLTYLVPFGAGAIGRRLVSTTGAKAVGVAQLLEHGDPALEAVATRVSQITKETVTARQVWDTATNHMLNLGIKGTEGGATLKDHIIRAVGDMGVDPEAASGVLNDVLSNAALEATFSRMNLVNEAQKLIATQGWSKARGELAQAFGINTKATEDILKQQITAGRGFTTKTTFQQAKASAAVLGQPRFVFSLPPFNLRFVGNRIIPYTFKFDGFQGARRFMSGLSGQTRLGKMVANGEATVDHMRAFWDGAASETIGGGLKGLRKYDKAMAEKLAGGSFLGLGSYFYPASESIGGLTAHFSAHAAELRGGGLGALVMADAARRARGIQEDLQDGIRDVKLKDGSTMSAAEVERETAKRLPTEGLSDEQIYERNANIHELQRLMPGFDHEVSPDAYYEKLIENHELTGRAKGTQNTQEHLDTLAVLRNRQQKAQQIYGLLKIDVGDDGLEAIAWNGQQGTTGHRALVENHIHDSTYIDSLDTVPAIRPGEDSRLFTRQGHEATSDKIFELESDTPVSTEDPRIGEQHLSDKGSMGVTARGYQLNLSRAANEPVLHEGLFDWNNPGYEDPHVTPLLPKKEPGMTRLFRGEEDVSQEGGGWFSDTPTYARTHGEKMHYVDVPNAVAEAAKEEAGRRGGHGHYWLEPEHANKAVRFRFRDSTPQEIGDRLEKAVVEQKHEFVTRVINPSTEATAQEVEARIRAAFEAAGLDTYDKTIDKVSSKTSPLIKDFVESESTYEEYIAQAVTRDLQEMGHDGIVSVDGKHVTVFHDPEMTRVKRLAENAPALPGYNGHVSYIPTPAVLDAVNGEISGGAIEAKRVLSQLDRKAAGHSLDDAEKMFRRQLKEKGVDLAKFEHIFETDPIKISSRRAAIIAHQVADRHLGNVSRALDSVGFTKSIFAGDAVGIARWRYVVGGSPETAAVADRFLENHDALARTKARGARLQAKLEAQNHEAELASQRLASLTDYVQTYLPGGNPNPLRINTDGTVTEGTREAEQLALFPSKTKEAAQKGLPQERPELLSAGARRDAELVREHEFLRDQVSATLSEANKIRAKMQTEQARPIAALVPADNALNMTGMERLDWLPGFKDMAMPSYMAQELHWASRGFKDLYGFHKDWRRFMGWWKTWATYLWPGFHVRNIEGSWFNNFLGGVTLKDWVTASRIRRAVHEPQGRWATEVISKHEPQVLKDMNLPFINGKAADKATYFDLGMDLGGVPGVQAAHGRSFAEARLGSEALANRLAKEHKLFPLKQWHQAGRAAGTMTENLVRTAAMVRGLQDHAGDWSAARAFTMMRHGDYADLTDFEYGWVRDVIPFYKWMRTNMPLQLHQLLESPAKLLAVNKARNAAWGVAGLDYEKDKYAVPEWMRTGFSVPIPGKDGAFNLVMADLPMNDLFTDGRTFLSSMLPTVRPFIENILKQQTFSGKPLTGERTVPLSGWFAPLDPLLTHLGLASKGADGKTYISDTAQNTLNILPMFSRFSTWAYADPDRVKFRTDSLISAVFGGTVRPINADSMISSELDFYYSHVVPEVDQLRKMGYPLPTTQDLKGVGETTDQILLGLGIDPASIQASLTTPAA